MESNNVPQTILQQLGSSRFALMTGAKNFVGSADSLSFSIPMSKGINKVRVILDPSDTYTVVFYKINLRSKTAAGICQKVAEVEGVYCDMLQDIFTSYTGMFTCL